MTLCQRSYPALKYSMDSFDLVEHFDILEGRLTRTKEKRVKFQDGLWGSIPEEILWAILMRLPVATQCRLRVVCKRWKLLLSTPSSVGQFSQPTGTIMCDYWHEWFFCHKENRWFRFPFQPKGFEKIWDLVATDGGLLCYEGVDDDSVSLVVCNPITGTYHELSPKDPGSSFWTTLLVDLESKTYKVVLMGTKATVIFDSKRNEWKVFESRRKAFPDLPKSRDHFPDLVWKNVIYQRVGKSRNHVAFDMELGVWRKECIDLPCDMDNFYHLGSWKDQVVLVQLYPSTKDPVRIWMLRNNGKDLSFASLIWEKVPVKIPKSMKALVSELHYCQSYGRDYVCFTTGWTHHWVKYTFQTKSWQIMPRLNNSYNYGKYREFEWFNFQPQIHMDPTVPHCKDGSSESSDDVGGESDDSESDESSESDHWGSGPDEEPDGSGEVNDSSDSDESDESGDPNNSAELDGSEDSNGSEKAGESSKLDGSDNSNSYDEADEYNELDGLDHFLEVWKEANECAEPDGSDHPDGIDKADEYSEPEGSDHPGGIDWGDEYDELDGLDHLDGSDKTVEVAELNGMDHPDGSEDANELDEPNGSDHPDGSKKADEFAEIDGRDDSSGSEGRGSE